MKAAIIHGPRDLRIEEVELPEMGARDVTVRIRAGGICGSDLHYYLHGGVGAIRLREPMILGHEIAGEVVAVGAEVIRVRPGDHRGGQPEPALRPVPLLPGRASRTTAWTCGSTAARCGCRTCRAASGSCWCAARHRRCRCRPDVPLAVAAFAEPLCRVPARGAAGRAAAGRARAGDRHRADRRARRSWSRGTPARGRWWRPTSPTRRWPVARRSRRRPRSLNTAVRPGRSGAFQGVDKGQFRRRVRGVRLRRRAGAGRWRRRGRAARSCSSGLGGGVTVVPLNLLVSEGDQPARHVPLPRGVRVGGGRPGQRRVIDVAPLLTEVFPLADAVLAFDMAADRSRAMKIQLAL